MAAYVDSRATADFGSFTCTEVSLVVWRPDVRAANIEEIDRVSW